MAQALQHLVPADVEVFEGVVGVVGQSGAMGVEVGDGDLLGDMGVGEGAGHRRVPANRPVSDRRRQGLRRSAV